MNMLVGYTGFVGGNLYETGSFDKVFNSKNITDAYGLKPDLLVYAGMRAEKYLANNYPEKDLELVKQAEENIEKISPKKLVLISTVDVLKDTIGKTENHIVETAGLQAYGYHRYLLECWVREHYTDALIVRLPALFGKNIKKNFIYDFIYKIPPMLKKEKFNELAVIDNFLYNTYQDLGNDFYKLKQLDNETTTKLRKTFEKLNFSSLNFTDSRSSYQFYPLFRLWNDIQIALANGLTLLHLATEPITAGEVYKYLTKEEFINELVCEPAHYDYHTIYASLFGGDGNYILSKTTILTYLKDFIIHAQYLKK